MKPITNIDDPRYVKAMRHPLRVRILAMLDERTASTVELGGWLGASLGTVAYHVRTLERMGLVELVHETRVRGAVEHHYNSVERPRVSDDAWAAASAPPTADTTNDNRGRVDIGVVTGTDLPMRSAAPMASVLSDIADLVSALAWPAVIVAVLWLLRAPLRALADRIAASAQKVSIGAQGLSVELASSVDHVPSQASTALASVRQPDPAVSVVDSAAMTMFSQLATELP